MPVKICQAAESLQQRDLDHVLRVFPVMKYSLGNTKNQVSVRYYQRLKCG